MIVSPGTYTDPKPLEPLDELSLVAESDLDRRLLGALFVLLNAGRWRTCVGCGCTMDHACPGGCAWVSESENVCTTCRAGGIA